ncbi:hypothetical protein PC120_g17941 [Phytophthora cactorum]|nr:hypothetical protein PC120_g17941 [Phytophthora cactorum]
MSPPEGDFQSTAMSAEGENSIVGDIVTAEGYASTPVV